MSPALVLGAAQKLARRRAQARSVAALELDDDHGFSSSPPSAEDKAASDEGDWSDGPRPARSRFRRAVSSGGLGDNGCFAAPKLASVASDASLLRLQESGTAGNAPAAQSAGASSSAEWTRQLERDFEAHHRRMALEGRADSVAVSASGAATAAGAATALARGGAHRSGLSADGAGIGGARSSAGVPAAANGGVRTFRRRDRQTAAGAVAAYQRRAARAPADSDVLARSGGSGQRPDEAPVSAVAARRAGRAERAAHEAAQAAMLEAVAPSTHRRKRPRDATGAARGVGDPFDTHLAKWEQRTAQQPAECSGSALTGGGSSSSCCSARAGGVGQALNSPSCGRPSSPRPERARATGEGGAFGGPWSGVSLGRASEGPWGGGGVPNPRLASKAGPSPPGAKRLRRAGAAVDIGTCSPRVGGRRREAGHLVPARRISDIVGREAPLAWRDVSPSRASPNRKPRRDVASSSSSSSPRAGSREAALVRDEQPAQEDFGEHQEEGKEARASSSQSSSPSLHVDDDLFQDGGGRHLPRSASSSPSLSQGNGEAGGRRDSPGLDTTWESSRPARPVAPADSVEPRGPGHPEAAALLGEVSAVMSRLDHGKGASPIAARRPRKSLTMGPPQGRGSAADARGPQGAGVTPSRVRVLRGVPGQGMRTLGSFMITGRPGAAAQPVKGALPMPEVLTSARVPNSRAVGLRRRSRDGTTPGVECALQQARTGPAWLARAGMDRRSAFDATAADVAARLASEAAVSSGGRPRTDAPASGVALVLKALDDDPSSGAFAGDEGADAGSRCAVGLFGLSPAGPMSENLPVVWLSALMCC